jgi:dTDP-4-amino-4,6-dideoxygalactose transaminase
MIPYGRQDVTDEDVAAVAKVLRSDFLTQGRQCRARGRVAIIAGRGMRWP